MQFNQREWCVEQTVFAACRHCWNNIGGAWLAIQRRNRIMSAEPNNPHNDPKPEPEISPRSPQPETPGPQPSGPEINPPIAPNPPQPGQPNEPVARA
jgi:hypothetical protein